MISDAFALVRPSARRAAIRSNHPGGISRLASSPSIALTWFTVAASLAVAQREAGRRV
jgi:hypothetical protein